MPIHFDLSAACVPCEATPSFTTNSNLFAVNRFQKTSDAEIRPPQAADDNSKCVEDQYDIKNQNIVHAVLFHNDSGQDHPKSLVGRFGHIERLSAWLHIIGGLVFAIYAPIRHTVIAKSNNTSQLLVTLASVGIAFCFLSSAVYHVTSPSRRLAYYTRQLDFLGIYSGIVLGSLADISIATRGFEGVGFLSILDLPLAAALTFVLFLIRRFNVREDETWKTFYNKCSLGLFRRTHLDINFAPVRASTSFILVTAFFTSTPSLFETLGSTNAGIILGLEILCFFTIVLGMYLDEKQELDKVLSNGKQRWLSCRNGGCVMSNHAFWHVLTLVGAVKATVSRELALMWM